MTARSGRESNLRGRTKMADILSFDKNCHHVSDDDLVWTLTLTTSDQKLAERVDNYVEHLISQKEERWYMHVCGNCKYAFRATTLPPCKDCTGCSKWEWDEEI